MSAPRNVLLAILLTLWSVAAAAQPAPTVTTTLRTTDTSASSVRVGCTQAGTCTGGIVAGPVDVASVTSAGFIGIANNVPVSTTMRLYNNAGTLMWNGSTVAIGGAISGTTGTIAKFTAPNAVGDSIMTESGTTITVASTLNATTLGGTLSTASQPNVTTMAGLTSAAALATVGTVTTGTWNATIIGLAKGGTGVDLSGTGGTSQFLRQNTVGGTVTVVRPAVSDLSDASNVALLNAVNTFSAANPIVLGAASKGTLRTDQAGYFTAQSGSNGFMFRNNGDSAAVAILENDGDWSYGGTNVTDSVGTPTLSVCTNCGSASIAGRDYAFKITMGTTTGAVSGTVTLSQTLGNAICVGNSSATTALAVTGSTNSLAFSTAADPGTGSAISIVCRGR